MTEYTSRRRPLTIGLIVLIAASIAAASMVTATQSRSQLETWTDEQAELADAVVHEVINGVFNDLEAVAAFFEEAHPDPVSFNRFVDSIDGTANAVGLAYVAIIPAESLDAHLEQELDERGDFYEISQLTSEGRREPVNREGRAVFYPVQLIALGEFIRPLVESDIPIDELGVGVDVGFNEEWRGHIELAVAADGPTISEFIQVELDIMFLDRVFFASVPVHDRAGRVTGMVAAPMLEMLLLRDLDRRVLDDVLWEVIPQGGTPTHMDANNVTIYPLEMAGAIWSLAIAPTDSALTRLQPRPWWVTGLAAGALAALISLALWLFIDRRGEHQRVAQFKQVADDKDRFLASVSHELRTPLTVVSGVANELHDQPDSFTAEEQSSLMEMLVEQTDELAAIVEDLLIAARNDIGKVVIHYQATDVAAETTRAMETAGVCATTHGAADLAWADDQRVRQILRNLLTNAKRYGGPTMKVEFSSNADWVQVVVADNGTGVAPEMERSMFESYQSSHKPDHGVRSVGLGLYISRNLAQAMGGSLDYTHAGGWSHFRLTLQSAGSDRTHETKDAARVTS